MRFNVPFRDSYSLCSLLSILPTKQAWGKRATRRETSAPRYYRLTEGAAAAPAAAALKYFDQEILKERWLKRMTSITVWTKQDETVAKVLGETGRYVAKKDYVLKDLDKHAYLMLEAYDWLAKNAPHAAQKPDDAEYPIWISFSQETTMLPSEGSIILELTLDPSLVTEINIDKWGAILNYSYIPADEQDAIHHRQLLEQYGVSDAKAYMSQFYPQIKRKITKSWSRLFDDSIVLAGNGRYGNIWEIKKEWVTQITR